MTAIIEAELSCDGPNADLFMACPHDSKLFGNSATLARRQARTQGWIQSRRRGKLVDICADCQRVTGPDVNRGAP
jgi:hypothetical protein